MNRHVAKPAKQADPGKIRGFQRVTTDDGFFVICALDHLSDFQELLDDDPSTVDHRRTVEAKIELVRTLSPEVSAFLLDPEFGLAHMIGSRALPRDIGLMASIENEDYAIPAGPRKTRIREGWTPHQAKMIGADVLKLLWFFRPDCDTAEHQRQVVRDLVSKCRDLSLALVVEPIWYPLEGEDMSSDQWKQKRAEGIVDSGHEADALGIDMLKAEFPGYVETSEGREAARKACRRLADGIDVPWVILSAGVGYDHFKEQVRIACGDGGASGFLAGRSIWRDAVTTRDPVDRSQAVKVAAGRLAELADITRKNGKPYLPSFEGKELFEAFPSDWYLGWQAGS